MIGWKEWLGAGWVQSRKGITDVIYSMIPQILRALVGFVSTILIARGLGVGGFGQYTLAASFTSLVVALSNLGINQTAVRYASRAAAVGDAEAHHAVLRWASRVRLVSMSLVMIVLFLTADVIAVRIWHFDGLTPLIRLSLITGAFGAVAVVPTLYYQSLKRFDIIAKILVAQTLISFSGILLVALLRHWSVTVVIFVSMAAAGVGAVIFLFSVPRGIIFGPCGLKGMSMPGVPSFWRIPFAGTKESNGFDHASPEKFAFFMLLSSVLIMIIMHTDVWLQGVFLDESQIGLYGAAMRFTVPLAIVLYSLNSALWPRVSTVTHSRDVLALLRKTFQLSTLVACGGVLYAIIIPLMAPWLLGKEYTNITLLGQLLCLRFCLAIFFIPVGLIGYNFGLVRAYAMMYSVQLVAVVLINVLLLPIYGPIGSAIALIMNEVVGLIFTASLLWKKVHSLREVCYERT